MKKFSYLLLLLVAVLAASCSPKHTIKIGILDYRDYTRNGFFITESDTAPFEYEAVGSVSVTELEGVANKSDVVTVVTVKERNEIYGDRNEHSGKWIYPTPQSALAALVTTAQEVFEANGIIQLRIKPVYDKKSKLIGWTVEGMLIKY